ncbi:hydroxymethylglutaryl-CoA synthase family protein [Schleiferia thermophila]|jgi:hydroxymethylglutaryl-CoA synthase|uniref:hydroxymethylglutaryl-CoA synthase family protein n=1 Tax=Schleiferia thermophila TaxID=884107 RepID=UPI002FD9EAE9
MIKVGLEAIAFDIPKIYLPIDVLAKHRHIEVEKLTKGLGLERMSFPDAHQDVVCLAANALYELFTTNDIHPQDIHRIYVGTECAVDASKPIASYLLDIMEQVLSERYGVHSLGHCDVVDMTFACIGGVDALLNCLDFIRLNPDKKAIVVCTDIAKYDLGSGGEYTQGAGAVAMLLSAEPKILSFHHQIGVSTRGVFDFFKPRRYVPKSQISVDDSLVQEDTVMIYKDQPVFDGQYSNQCYIDRMKEAYYRCKELKETQRPLFEGWSGIFMHLPYCYQARRMFVEIFASETTSNVSALTKDEIRALSKSEEYLRFVQEKIYPSEILSAKVGNIYTGSIFLGLISGLNYWAETGKEIAGTHIGFISYGSGSKSKVFEATLENGWRQAIEKTKATAKIERAIPISFEQYLGLYHNSMASIQPPAAEFILEKIEKDSPTLLGARYYKWIP